MSDSHEATPALPARGFGGGDLARATLLMQQRRFEDAEEHLRRALAADPDDGTAHRLLAWCRLTGGDTDAALHEAREALRVDPDRPDHHALLSRVHAARDEDDAAERAARRAIELDPHDAGLWSTLARSLACRKRWRDALDAADRGLAVEPDDADCRNLRAMCLTQLGRRDEATATLAGTLERDPDDANAHASLGWTRLHARRPREALESFREALRLDPTHAYAKAGLVEALKARNPIYRWMLAFFLWMNRLGERMQWGLIIGAFVGYQVLRAIARNNEALRPWLTPLIVAYVGFVLLTWLAVPLFNLLLRLDRFGRHALMSDQRRGSNLLGAILLAAAALAVVAVVTRDVAWLVAAMPLLGVAIPGVGVFRTAPGPWRTGMAAYTVVMAALWLALAAVIVGAVDGPLAEGLFGPLLTAWVIGLAAGFWVVNIVVARHPARSIA